MENEKPTLILRKYKHSDLNFSEEEFNKSADYLNGIRNYFPVEYLPELERRFVLNHESMTRDYLLQVNTDILDKFTTGYVLNALETGANEAGRPITEKYQLFINSL